MHLTQDKSPAQIRSHGSPGFTLTELLVTIGILAILASLVITISPGILAKAHRVSCATNMKQQLTAFNLYAADNNNARYWPAKSGEADNAPAFLYPQYLTDVSVFICPATKNVIRQTVKNRLTGSLVDLEDNASGAADKSGGHSYEYFGNYSIPDNYIVGTSATPRLKRPNHYWREAHDTNLIVDADDFGRGNYPDKDNNHGAIGWNWGFADGHVEWITAGQTEAAFKRNGPEPKQ